MNIIKKLIYKKDRIKEGLCYPTAPHKSMFRAAAKKRRFSSVLGAKRDPSLTGSDYLFLTLNNSSTNLPI
jgi:hypothetical protein